jgi:hypothetical protein
VKSGQVGIATENTLIEDYSMFRNRSALSSVCAVLFFGVLVLPVAPTTDGRAVQGENETKAAETSGTKAHPVLVELFTSEGCSSCPPADVLLEKMDTLQPVPDAQLIVLSEHVDYWDHDGWKDPNSSPALTERQAAYVRALGLKTAYTPQIVVDGASEMRANDPQEVDKVFHEATVAPKILVRISDVGLDVANPAILRTRIEADDNSNQPNADVYVAVALDRVESQVLHGENGGQHLTHVAVVVGLTRIGKLPMGKDFDQTAFLKLKPNTDPKNVRVVAFVQEPGPGRVLGAALWKPAS